MHQDILKFRKLFKILKETKKYTLGKLSIKTGLSDPVIHKLLNADEEDIKGVRSSTIGAVQDFIKDHINDLTYAGIESCSIGDRDGEARMGTNSGSEEENF